MDGAFLTDTRPQRLSVPAPAAGLRLDQFLAAYGRNLSRSLARKVIEIGGVYVDGRRTRRCGEPLRTGQTVVLYRDQGPLDTPFRLTEEHILYRDQYLLAIDKPAGVETQPTPARYRGTLYAALLDFLKNPWRPLDRPALGMVQRLDRETSGVMIFSIHPRSHKGLTRAFAERQVAKTYQALVHGRLQNEEGHFTSRLARHRNDNRMRSVERGGREAVTRYRVLERFATATLVEVVLVTGRMHQIRVHFAEAGHPLLGDRKYHPQQPGAGVPRQMLHAASLGLRHPIGDAELRIASPLPKDMQDVLQRLRGNPAPDAGVSG